MEGPQLLLFSLFGFIVLVFYVFRRKPSRYGSSNLPLPPVVPWALPIFGHLLYFGSNPCVTLIKWKKKYGPVFVVYFGSFRTVVFNDAKSLREAFKVTALADRPPMPTLLAANKEKGVGFVKFYNNGEQKHFLMKNLKRYCDKNSQLEKRINMEIPELLDTFAAKGGKPFSPLGMFIRPSLNPVLGIITSFRFSKDDKRFDELEHLLYRLTAIPSVFASMGMYMPWLSKLFPKLTGVTEYGDSFGALVNFMENRIQERKKSRVRNQPRDLMDAYMDNVDNTVDTSSTFHSNWNFMPHSFSDMFLASGDTTSTGLEWMILLLTRHQDVQRKIQEEIDAVVGNSRSPTLSDKLSMPYTDAAISEILRFSGFATIGGVPHYTYEDSEACGYFIPKDTLLLQNTYGIQKDPEQWGDPEIFKVGRFLDDEGKFKNEEGLVIFGTGKRACMGEFIARDLIFLITTGIFQRFNVIYGSKIPPTTGKFGLAIHPEPFEIVVTERFPKKS